MSFPRSGAGVRGTNAMRATLGTVLATLLIACSGGGPAAPAAPTPQAAPERVEVAGLAESTTFTNLASAQRDPAPQELTDGVVLHAKQDLAVQQTPDGPVFARLPAKQLNNPTWVPVIAQRGPWAQVLLPSRPNGSTGWVRADDPRQVGKARTPYVVDVDIDARRMTLWKDGREISTWTVGVGNERAPTPRGRTFIMASIAETVTRFSPIILPLGTHSETWSNYGGGPGTVAIHGWPDPGVFGSASSDGCVRAPNGAMRLLTSLPLGTLVRLR